MAEVDVVVVGAGPNGLAAALTCAQAGRSVLVVEAKDTIGGGCRTAELTLPGFRHDVCSAIHPLAAASPFFTAQELAQFGLDMVQPELPLVHPLDGGRAGVLHQSVEETVAGLGVDGKAWDRHIGWAARRWDDLSVDVLGPVVHVPKHPLTFVGFGLRALLPATWAAKAFKTDEARALFAGCAAHSFLPLNRPFTTALGLPLLASAHAVGWPFPRGGSQAIVDAMAAKLQSLGGRIETGREIRSTADLPDARAVMFDVTPRQLVDICGDELASGYRKRLSRYKYGPGVFKVDFALSEPVPWANPDAARAGCLHLGGTIEEIAAAEAEVSKGRHPDRPFTLVAQQTQADPSRAPEGQHTLWTYCHAPKGSTVDMTDAIEAQIERFAPGFRDVVLARHSAGSDWFEDHNANYIGGDIAGGSHEISQLVFRPRPGVRPYRTGNARYFLCSASTPPGGGVHGMCGMKAAEVALATALH